MPITKGNVSFLQPKYRHVTKYKTSKNSALQSQLGIAALQNSQGMIPLIKRMGGKVTIRYGTVCTVQVMFFCVHRWSGILLGFSSNDKE